MEWSLGLEADEYMTVAIRRADKVMLQAIIKKCVGFGYRFEA